MKFIAIFIFIFTVLVVILADAGILPHFIRKIYDFPNGDKNGHFILFGLLNFFIAQAFLSSVPFRSRAWSTLSIGLTLALIVALEEYSQKYFSTRTFSLVDLFASYLGIFVGGWIVLKIIRS